MRIGGVLLLALLPACAQQAEERPLFSFGVVADAQYADKAAAGARDYRASMGRLEDAVRALDGRNPAFVIQLGDIVDGAGADLDAILPVYDGLRAPHYHVRGNHDPRAIGQPYYDFGRHGWRFIVLDGMNVNVANAEGRAVQSALRSAGAKNAADWNGGIGSAQKEWLRKTLTAAAARQERALVFCHFPILQEASTPAHLLWNAGEILRIVEEYPGVRAWFNGHDHRGGYAQRNGIHHVTFPGMVESGARNSYTVVEVFGDRLELRGFGTAPSRALPLNP
jgi:3',5'-cyclic AMP phosphodiesterase CpdA